MKMNIVPLCLPCFPTSESQDNNLFLSWSWIAKTLKERARGVTCEGMGCWKKTHSIPDWIAMQVNNSCGSRWFMLKRWLSSRPERQIIWSEGWGLNHKITTRKQIEGRQDIKSHKHWSNQLCLCNENQWNSYVGNTPCIYCHTSMPRG